MIKKLPYHCKFCHRPGQADYDDTCAEFKLAQWQEFLACNRCAVFFESKCRSEDRVERICCVLQEARLGCVSRSKLPEVEAAMTERITALTRDYALLVARYLRTGNAWETDFVAQILEKPSWARTVMHQFYKHCRKNQHQLQPEPRELNEQKEQMPLG